MLNNLLSEEKPLHVSRTLAKNIGLLETVIYSAITSLNKEFVIIQDIEKIVCFVERITIKRKLGKLIKLGYLNEKVLSPEEKKLYLQQNKSSNKSFGNLECEWCESTTIVLQEHHYPIPRCKGGQDIVNICPNCHYEFHSLNKAYYI